MDSIKQQSLSADITRVVNDYQQIFGDLNLPDDLSAAEEQLEVCCITSLLDSVFKW